MKVVAAFLLAFLGGNTSPSAEDIKKILSSVGAEADDEMIELLLSNVAGKDVIELIGAGMEMLASVTGGGSAVASASSSGVGVAATDAPTAEAKKEEKEVVVEESDDEMCLSLFD